MGLEDVIDVDVEEEATEESGCTCGEETEEVGVDNGVNIAIVLSGHRNNKRIKKYARRYFRKLGFEVNLVNEETVFGVALAMCPSLELETFPNYYLFTNTAKVKKLTRNTTLSELGLFKEIHVFNRKTKTFDITTN